jgi:hypothetical protein
MEHAGTARCRSWFARGMGKLFLWFIDVLALIKLF